MFYHLWPIILLIFLAVCLFRDVHKLMFIVVVIILAIAYFWRTLI